MTRDETRKAAAVMLAWADGRNVEVTESGDDKWVDTHDPIWDWDGLDYRIKNGPKLRPWTEDDVPVGAIVRRNGARHRWLITDTMSVAAREELVPDFEYSTDGGKTWLPCGVEEAI